MTTKRLFTLVLIAVFAVPFAVSQTGAGAGRGRGTRNYNLAAEMTVNGTVEGVMHPTGQKGIAGTHLTLKSDQGTFDVHVGPSSYISAQQFAFAKGDTVEVIGSKVKVEGQEAILARQITKDNKVLTLRNEQGFPLWSRRASSTK